MLIEAEVLAEAEGAREVTEREGIVTEAEMVEVVVVMEVELSVVELSPPSNPPSSPPTETGPTARLFAVSPSSCVTAGAWEGADCLLSCRN